LSVRITVRLVFDVRRSNRRRLRCYLKTIFEVDESLLIPQAVAIDDPAHIIDMRVFIMLRDWEKSLLSVQGGGRMALGVS